MITRNRILFILGIWNVLLPFLGFPGSFRTFFIIVSGLATILLAFLYARDKRVSEIRSGGPKREVVTEVYAENRPTNQTSQPVRSPFEQRNSFPRSSVSGTSSEERFTDLKSILKQTKTF